MNAIGAAIILAAVLATMAIVIAVSLWRSYAEDRRNRTAELPESAITTCCRSDAREPEIGVAPGRDSGDPAERARAAGLGA